MARKREERAGEDLVVEALCRDFERRAEEIEAGRLSRRVLMEYLYINKKLFDAAGEICGAALAEVFISDIGMRRGYAASEASMLGESTYKRYKREIMDNAARKLHYAD